MPKQFSECTAMIRAKYPDPVEYTGENAEGSYCVGGALMRHLHGDHDNCHVLNFPEEPQDIADGIRAINPSCPSHFAQIMGRHIPNCNDKGQFNAAWGFLDMALSYRPQLTHQKE